MTRLISPGRAMWSMPSTPYMSPAAIGCTMVRSRGLAGLREPLADAGEDGVGAAETRRRADRHHRSVPDQGGGFDRGQYRNLSH